MKGLAAILSGLLFGAGLTLAGMVNPMKVQNFMDIFGTWDPTLLFVMGAGLLATFFGYRIVFGWQRPVFAERFVLPEATRIDAPLVVGAILFGLGWGLTGFCPGPAIASLVFGFWPSVVFVAAMAVGLVAVRAITHRPAASPQAPSVEG